MGEGDNQIARGGSNTNPLQEETITLYRGYALGAGRTPDSTSGQRGVVHDFGEGMYFAFTEELAEEHARKGVSELQAKEGIQTRPVVVKVVIARSLLGG